MIIDKITEFEQELLDFFAYCRKMLEQETNLYIFRNREREMLNNLYKIKTEVSKMNDITYKNKIIDGNKFFQEVLEINKNVEVSCCSMEIGNTIYEYNYKTGERYFIYNRIIHKNLGELRVQINGELYGLMSNEQLELAEKRYIPPPTFKVSEVD